MMFVDSSAFGLQWEASSDSVYRFYQRREGETLHRETTKQVRIDDPSNYLTAIDIWLTENPLAALKRILARFVHLFPRSSFFEQHSLFRNLLSSRIRSLDPVTEKLLSAPGITQTGHVPPGAGHFIRPRRTYNSTFSPDWFY